MSRRQTLVRIVGVFAACSVLAFAFVFLDAAFPDDPQKIPTKFVIDINELVEGEPRIFNISPTRPLLVLLANSKQLNGIALLEPHVWDSAINGETFEKRVLVHWALSTGKFGGCRLKHVPAASQLVSSASENTQWLGGYWGAGCEASYDYAGRAIKNSRYGYSEYVDRSTSLRSPAVTMVDDDHISITIE